MLRIGHVFLEETIFTISSVEMCVLINVGNMKPFSEIGNKILDQVWKMGRENLIFWSEIGLGFQEVYYASPPKVLRRFPPMGLENLVQEHSSATQ